MRITEVQIELVTDPTSRVLAFGRVVFDRAFVVRELKILRGPRGLFVAMPDRKVKDHCPRCHRRNVLDARWCNWCSADLGGPRVGKRHADVAHPIGPEFREQLELAVIAAYQAKLQEAA